jgi:hypothetical protein
MFAVVLPMGMLFPLLLSDELPEDYYSEEFGVELFAELLAPEELVDDRPHQLDCCR